MTDIVEFLTARLDEDEAAALEAEKKHTFWGSVFHPVRPLREVAAKRAHLRMYVQQQGMLNHVRTYSDQFTHDTQVTATVSAGVLEAVVRQDAAIYADHPDYNPAWKLTP